MAINSEAICIVSNRNVISIVVKRYNFFIPDCFVEGLLAMTLCLGIRTYYIINCPLSIILSSL